MMNKEGFSYQEAEGSVVDYFKDQSSGKFIAEYDVVGPIKLSKTKSYYGDNDYDGDDKNAQQMIYDACLEADLLVDFSKYDNDGDGVLDFVYVYSALCCCFSKTFCHWALLETMAHIYQTFCSNNTVLGSAMLFI